MRISHLCIFACLASSSLWAGLDGRFVQDGDVGVEPVSNKGGYVDIISTGEQTLAERVRALKDSRASDEDKQSPAPASPSPRQVSNARERVDTPRASPNSTKVLAAPTYRTPTKLGGVPLPDYDPSSRAWSQWKKTVDTRGGRAWELALLAAVTGNARYCDAAIEKSDWIAGKSKVSQNQYLRVNVLYPDVFFTLAWCDVPEPQAERWIDWGKKHLGRPDGSIRESIWWSRRWSRNNPANNYFHSFILATTAYAMAADDEAWLTWLREDRLPLMYRYYERTPEGGSREGTNYGESHRAVFQIAKLWRDYDGTEVVPQEFIDNSLRFWNHAIAPGHWAIAPIGDQTRSKGKLDGFYCDIFDNALAVAKDPEAIAMGRWRLANMRCYGSHVFRKDILRDYDHAAQPPDMPLAYHAKGAGVLFVRDSWRDDATFLFFTAGKRDEAHQHDDQGAFAVWAGGRWQTVSDSVWTRTGIEQGVDVQNVIRFPSARNIKGKSGRLRYVLEDDILSVDMNLSEVVGEEWQRSAVWHLGSRSLTLTDTFKDANASFGFETPSADDARAPYGSEATVEVQRTATGMQSVVSW